MPRRPADWREDRSRFRTPDQRVDGRSWRDPFRYPTYQPTRVLSIRFAGLFCGARVRKWPVASLSALQRYVRSWGQSGLEIDTFIWLRLTTAVNHEQCPRHAVLTGRPRAPGG